MGKNVVILCDGTWNTLDAKGKTNIAKLQRLLSDQDDQYVEYFAGVGTDSNKFMNMFNGAIGGGIDDNVKAAYKAISNHYVEGDRLFLFGFSRGAATARAVACMIANVGLVRPHPSNKTIDAAYECYTAVEGVDLTTDKNATKFASCQNCIRPNIDFLGVFDTVPALGLPGKDDDKFWFGNLDMILSPEIKVARHALAIDELRSEFQPDLWDPIPETDSEQRWFAGVHSDVGGSYQHHGLADITLNWMLEAAIKCGLHVSSDFHRLPISDEPMEDDDVKSNPDTDMAQMIFRPNYNGKQHQSYDGLYKAKPAYHRKVGEKSDETIDESVELRLNAPRHPKYEPVNLPKNRKHSLNSSDIVLTEVDDDEQAKKKSKL